MKKTLAVLSIIVLVMVKPLCGQTVIKTHMNIIGKWSSYQDKYVLGEPKYANITFSIYEKYISVDDESNSIYRAVKKTHDEQIKDGKMLTYECLDEKNRTCHFTYMQYDDPDREDTIMIMYDTIMYVYFIKQIITDGD